jgi:hypothetical protein
VAKPIVESVSQAEFPPAVYLSLMFVFSEHDVVGLSPDNRLLFISAEADLEETLVFKKSFLKK